MQHQLTYVYVHRDFWFSRTAIRDAQLAAPCTPSNHQTGTGNTQPFGFGTNVGLPHLFAMALLHLVADEIQSRTPFGLPVSPRYRTLSSPEPRPPKFS